MSNHQTMHEVFTMLPKGIGPHEGKELLLMRQGRKNVALFYELEPNNLDQFLVEGYSHLKFLEFGCEGKHFYTWIIFRDGYSANALRLKEIITQPNRGFDAAREHEIGRILSYSREDVDLFLKHTEKLMCQN